MNDHTRAVVPVGEPAGYGRIAEALLFHERVVLHVESVETLARFVDWFVAPGEVETLLILLRDGKIAFSDRGEGLAAFRERVLSDTVMLRLLQGQWRHARWLKYAVIHEVPPVAGRPESLAAAVTHLEADVHVPRDALQATLAALGGDFRLTRLTDRFSISPLVDRGELDSRDVLAIRRRSSALRHWVQGTIESFTAARDSIEGIAPSAERERIVASDAARATLVIAA